MSFGSDLQREREQRGVSLENLADGTKVSTRHLRALESGDLAAMPGGIFNRGMVRSYCRYLGLDEDAWLNRFGEVEPPTNETNYAEFAENVKRSRPESAPNVRRRWLIVILLLLLLGAAAYASWRYVLAPRLHPNDAAQPVSADANPH